MNILSNHNDSKDTAVETSNKERGRLPLYRPTRKKCSRLAALILTLIPACQQYQKESPSKFYCLKSERVSQIEIKLSQTCPIPFGLNVRSLDVHKF